MIKGYHTINQVFNKSEFLEEMLKNQQNIRLSRSGASHPNGEAERAIKTVVTMNMTMLIHYVLIYSEGIFYTTIWPMSMYYDTQIYNIIPYIQSGISACQCLRYFHKP